MTKKKIFEKTIPLHPIFGNYEYTKDLVLKCMEEYGEYCAEQSWYHASANSLEGNFDITDFKEYWNEFKAKEQ